MKFKYLVYSSALCLLSCSKPIDNIKEKIWIGNVVKFDGQKTLSEIVLQIIEGKAIIYSNAIFGSDNDTVSVTQGANDSTLVFGFSDGKPMSLIMRYKKEDKTEQLILIGEDFYSVLNKSDLENLSSANLSFYKNIKVPREAYLYLDGTYEGDIEMESSSMNLALGSMMGGSIHLKYVFMENNKVKQFVKNVMLEVFGGKQKPTIETYTIEGNKLYIGKRDKNTKGLEIRDNGNTLVLQTDDANIVLRKVY